MSPWSDLTLQGNWSLLLLIPLVAATTLYSYRKTSPAVGDRMRVCLTACRTLAMTILILILAEPLFGFLSSKVIVPSVVVLIDSSASMATTENGVQRLERVRNVVNSDDFVDLFAGANIAGFQFSEQAFPILLGELSTLQPGGRATDIAAAVRQSVSRVEDPQRLSSILLITDGAHNQGEDPAIVVQETGVPVFSLHVGREQSSPDVQIVGTDGPQIGYLDRPFSLAARIRSWGFEERQTEVRLYEEDDLISRRDLHLTGGSQLQTVEFEVRPSAVGSRLFRVVLPAQEGELTEDNNQAAMLIRIHEEKVSLLLLAGGPSPDLAFVRRSLESDSTISVRTVIRKGGNEFYGEAKGLEGELQRCDVIALIDPDSAMMGGAIGISIRDRVLAGAGLLFAGGQKTYRSWKPDSPVAAILPVAAENGSGVFREEKVDLKLDNRGRTHPVVRVPRTGAGTGSDPWTQLPPLPGYFPISRLKPGSMALVQAGSDHSTPLIAVGYSGEGKVISVAASDYWRLDLLSSGFGGCPETIRRFWTNAVRWLAIRTPAGRVRVSTDRDVYKGGEQVAFAAQVYDELMQPNGEAVVTISLQDQESSLQLRHVGSGSYSGSWKGLSPGSYDFRADAVTGGSAVGHDTGSFLVERHTVESVSVRPDPALLDKIAQVTGGRSSSLDQWRPLLDSMPLQKRLEDTSSEYSIWDHQWLIALATILLTTEWAIRKKAGMI